MPQQMERQRTTIYGNGQIVVPKNLCDALNWKAGTEIEFVLDGSVVTLREPARERRLPTLDEVRQVGGMLKHHGPVISEEEIEYRLDESFKNEWRR